ncbi:MAG: hypothetical protein ACE37I_18845 [Rubinisphaera brasiliensis]|uniref:hypothetical protein n=1 Tax=Rubinisphaera brasiliensis TaxID=119 RepID=UPI0039196727
MMPRISISVLLLAVMAASPSALSAAEIREYSIPEFVAAKAQWSRWTGETIRVEGRYRSFSPNAMQFQKCDLFFYLPRDINRPLGRSRTLEVIGQLKEDRNGLSFRVDSLRLLPEDNELFHVRRRTLPEEDPNPWYELGKQTLQRGRFYEDALLAKLGEETLADGLQIEKGRRKNVDAKFLQSLASKAAQLGLDDDVRLPYVHEALRQQWQEQKTADEPDYISLRKKLSSDLPGAAMLLTSLTGKRFDDYRRSPIETFNKSTSHARKQLSRLFYLEVARAEYQHKLKPSGSNGDTLAAEYARIAPDDIATSEYLRQQALLFRTENIGDATRSEVYALAAEYRKKNEPEMAQTALRTWLDRKRQRLNNAGPADYLQTASDYAEWLGDRPEAEQIALAGLKRYPQDRALQAQLTRWGYADDDGEWKPASEIAARPRSDMEAAVQAGRIVTGMAPEQVISSLGAPRTMTRIAFRDKTMLTWNYPEAKLAIRFEQRHHQGDFEVSSIDALPPSR